MPIQFNALVAQWPLWTERGDMDEYVIAAAVMAALGTAIHAAWLWTHPKAVLDIKMYRTGDVGSTSHPRVEDATCFTYLVLSCVFAFNWLAIHIGMLPSPLTVGMQSGACAGYELYSALIEVHLLLMGTRRVDMLVHHTLCFAFIGMTCVTYVATSATDLVYWHLVWDSISRMLVSNVPLNLRHFYRDQLPVNALFALTFLTVRGLEQSVLIADMYTLLASNAHRAHALLAWRDGATGGVIACWAALQCLNAVWIFRVLRQIVRMLCGSQKCEKRGC